MDRTMTAPAALAADLQAFLEREKLDLKLLPQGSEATVQVVQASEKGELSDMHVIRAGGAIRCATALAMAPKLGVPAARLGALLDHLGVKIKDCSLGCFK